MWRCSAAGSKGRHGLFHLWMHVWVAGKLCDPSLTCAIPEHLSGELLSIRRYTNVLFTCSRTHLPLLSYF